MVFKSSLGCACFLSHLSQFAHREVVISYPLGYFRNTALKILSSTSKEDDCELSDGLKDIYMRPTAIFYGLEVKISRPLPAIRPIKIMD